MSPLCVMYRTHGSEGYWSWCCFSQQWSMCDSLSARKQTYLGLDDLEVPHLNTTGREIWNFKFDPDWSFCLTSPSDATHAASKASHHATSTLLIAFDAGQA
jgi:hypothetical protein